MRFERTKGEIRVEKGDFRGSLGGFEGFGPCLGISHHTHRHLGKISQIFLAAPLSTSGHPTPDESVLPAARVNVIAAAIRFY